MKNYILTEEQLTKIVEQIKSTTNEEHKEGSYMAKQQLFTIATLAYKMWENMEDGEQLEDWMESKIAQSESSIISFVLIFNFIFCIKKPFLNYKIKVSISQSFFIVR
jgi:hypothetical protein